MYDFFRCQGHFIFINPLTCHNTSVGQPYSHRTDILKGFAPSHTVIGVRTQSADTQPALSPLPPARARAPLCTIRKKRGFHRGEQALPTAPRPPAAAPGRVQLPYADAAFAEVTQLTERADKCQALTRRHPPSPTGSWLAAPPRGLQMPLLLHNHPTLSPCAPCYLNSNKRYDKKKVNGLKLAFLNN